MVRSFYLRDNRNCGYEDRGMEWIKWIVWSVEYFIKYLYGFLFRGFVKLVRVGILNLRVYFKCFLV